jgi:hypothetical protein
MIEHLNKNLLQKYGNRQLNPAELISVVTHLENCGKCYKEFTEMFPQINQTIADFNKEIINRNEPFHLDYDEHLRPYIDETINEIDREIIESHLENCSSCSHQVRDLREFKESLELKKLKQEIAEKAKESVWTKFGNWFTANTRILAFGSLLIVVSLLGLFAFFNLPKQNDQAKVEPNINVAVPIQTPNVTPTDGVVTPTPTNIKVETNVNKPLPTVKNVNVTATPTPSPTITPQETELAEIKLPNYLKDLRTKTDSLRGNSDGKTEQIAIISPNGKVIRETSPTLNFNKLEGIETYEVSIYNGSTLIKKEIISSNSWRVSVTLSKEKLYEWQVSAKSGDKNYLGQGKFYIVSQVDENKIRRAKDSLQRGKAFAEAGLIDDARREFKQYLKQNPGSQSAKKLLLQIASKK